jgi:hypothetical protein
VTVLLVIIIVTLAVVLSVAQYKRILPSKTHSIFVWVTPFEQLHDLCMDCILENQFLYMNSMMIMLPKRLSKSCGMQKALASL